jgi:hypothetical protein
MLPSQSPSDSEVVFVRTRIICTSARRKTSTYNTFRVLKDSSESFAVASAAHHEEALATGKVRIPERR